MFLNYSSHFYQFVSIIIYKKYLVESILRLTLQWDKLLRIGDLFAYPNALVRSIRPSGKILTIMSLLFIFNSNCTSETLIA
jgi:hypothetical protein